MAYCRRARSEPPRRRSCEPSKSGEARTNPERRSNSAGSHRGWRQHLHPLIDVFGLRTDEFYNAGTLRTTLGAKDVAIRVDTTLFLVEAKSGRVSWPALRGAPERTVRDINELIVAASNQSARLAQRLGEELNGTRTADPLNFPIALEGLRSVVRLSVTLHDFATLQSIPRLVVDAGLAEGAQRLAPCISLADFEAVAELLDSPHILLHYQSRRASA